MKIRSIGVLLLVVSLLPTSCATSPTPALPAAEAARTPESAGLANPASVHCEEQGGRVEIRTGDHGGQLGYCIFPDGSECEEWTFFRGECTPGGEASASHVRVGVLLPSSGSFGWVGDAISAIELAVQEINLAGGVNGKPIELIVRDTQTDPDTAAAVATTLLDEDEVVAIIGPTSLTVHSIIPLVQDRGVVAISPTAGTTTLDTMGGQFIFRTVSSDVVMGTGMAWFAVHELGASKVALFFEDTDSAASISGVLRLAAQVLGLEVVADITFAEAATTYRSELMQMAEGNPDVVFFEANSDSAAVFFAEKKELGLEAMWIGTDTVNQSLAEALGEAGEGVMGVNPAAEITDRYNEWQARLEERRGKAGVPPFSANAYDAMITVALAMEAAGNATRSAVAESLRDISNSPGVAVTTFAEGKESLANGRAIDYEGLAGPQDFNEFGDVVTSLQSVIIEDGVLVRTGTLTQADIGDTLQQVLETTGQ